MVDRFQTKEGAQEALQRLSSHQERAPSALKSTQDFLSLEFEAILTPQLQVGLARPTHGCRTACTHRATLPRSVSPVADLHGDGEAQLDAVDDQEQRAVPEEVGRRAGETGAAGGPQAGARPNIAALQVAPLLPKTWYDHPSSQELAV